MGKIHRIKRSFYKVVAQNPWQEIAPGSVKRYQLAGQPIGWVSIDVGVRANGSCYLGYYGESYKGLMRKLIHEYESGVAHGDKGFVKS